MAVVCVSPADSSAIWPQHEQLNQTSERDSYPQAMLGIFFQALTVVEKHFVEEVAEQTLLKNAIQKMVFVTPPYCQDNLVSIQDCPYDPPRCFSDSIFIISSRCGYDPDKLSLKALDLLLRDLDPYSST
ncbi:MAG: hypothetical protein NTY51_07645, partial [Deltaproteobacteria bacterium]|nr:hypothetical protein [Deltaproteobacteria bacterium]